MMSDSIDAVVRLEPCMQESNDALNNARLAEKTDNALCSPPLQLGVEFFFKVIAL